MARTQTATQTGVGSTRWFKVNSHVTPFSASVQVGLGGTTATYQVEVTLDETDPMISQPIQFPGSDQQPPAAVPILAPGTASVSADGIVAIQQPVMGVRVTVTAGTGTARVRVLQAGLV